MSQYHAPLAEMRFVMNELAGLGELAKLTGFEDATSDTVEAVLEEAARFATDVLDPLNRVGDRQGASLDASGQVTTKSPSAPAWKMRMLRPGGMAGMQNAE